MSEFNDVRDSLLRDASRADMQFLEEALFEVTRARRKHGPQHSLHEAYAVILEELDEFWDEVRKQTADRSWPSIHKELLQIAAMACRAAVDCAPIVALTASEEGK